MCRGSIYVDFEKTSQETGVLPLCAHDMKRKSEKQLQDTHLKKMPQHMYYIVYKKKNIVITTSFEVVVKKFLNGPQITRYVRILHHQSRAVLSHKCRPKS